MRTRTSCMRLYLLQRMKIPFCKTARQNKFDLLANFCIKQLVVWTPPPPPFPLAFYGLIIQYQSTVRFNNNVFYLLKLVVFVSSINFQRAKVIKWNVYLTWRYEWSVPSCNKRKVNKLWKTVYIVDFKFMFF